MPELTATEKEAADTPQVTALLEHIRTRMDDADSEFAQDWTVRLDSLYRYRNDTLLEIQIVEGAIAKYKESEEREKAVNVKLDEECVLEEKKVGAMEIQRDAVKQLLEIYEAEIIKRTVQAEKLQAMAGAIAEKITEYQLQVSEKIEGKESGVRSQESGVVPATRR
jgi:hypothetical protein